MSSLILLISINTFCEQKPRWEENGVWKESNARDYCEDYLRNNTLGEMCSTLPGVNVDKEIQTCMEDIQVLQKGICYQRPSLLLS